MSYDGMNRDFASRLQQLVEASGGRIRMTSGYRSEQRQKQLFDAAVKKYGSVAAARKWVAPPGKSNHGRGIAADLSGDLKLAHRLAGQYGLHFPMSWEPWHIEPVGVVEKADPEAYTPDPDTGLPPQPNRNNLEYQLASFMDVIHGGISDDPFDIDTGGFELETEGVDEEQMVTVDGEI